MRSTLILAIFAFFFVSCHNDVPELPSPDEVKNFTFCKYESKDGVSQCESSYKVSKTECKLINGELYSDKKCTEPYEEEP